MPRAERLRVGVATERDRDRIYRLRHEVYASELHQHPENEAGTLTDELDSFNDFLDLAEALLGERELEGVVQVASFHPGYRFAGVGADDPANFSNRSPHPTLHLLREASVTRSVDAHPDPLAIPKRNATLLREIGSAAMQARLVRCQNDERG